MVPIRLNLFPGGRRKAVTLSYDDGMVHDRKLVAILDRHGLRGTFHLNSGKLGQKWMLEPGEIPALFGPGGHEVSAHSVSHPCLEGLPPDQLAREILDDRRALEALAGRPVRGMSYPFATYSPAVVAALPALGIEYARTAESHGRFHLPENPLLWHPTCHHKDDLAAKAEAFLAVAGHQRALLFYVWGHTYEFEHEGNWDLIERFCERMAEAQASGAASLWFATNIDIVDYLQALGRLRTGVDGRFVQNLSHRPVWITWDGEIREIPPGPVVSL